ncbi:MAG: Fe-S cluster assembly protein SufD [Phaeodactylibacter sp.]|uniref:Fe-S cluster assembly protein SufD n=1 Tax=Phaeodactylibacter sp. TaxID=1940289 RepID=UPI0032F06A73
MSSTVAQDRYAAEKEKFQSLFQQTEAANQQPSHPLDEYRQRAMDLAGRLDFPTRRWEEYKYTSVNRILQPDYHIGQLQEISADTIKSFMPEGMHAHLIVFVNGQLSEQLSHFEALPEGMHVMLLRDALDSDQFGQIARAQLDAILEGQDDIFVALNAAFSQHSLFLYSEKNVACELPVYILHLSTNAETPILNSHMNIAVAETGSEFAYIEGQFEKPGATGTYFNNIYNRVSVGANAHIHHYCLQQEGAEGYVINRVDAEQERDSQFSNYTVDLGGRIVRNNLNTLHKGSNLTTNYYGVYFGKEQQHIDNHTFIDHAVPHCQSNELYKGIVTDSARGVFNGKVMVRKDAQKTNAFQQSSSLVLSNKAEMDSKPQLEIFADDVKCSHGATIGQLDESSVFYLRSRGLNDHQARAMLQHAFIAEVLEYFKHEQIRDFAEMLINKKFEQ